MPQQVGVGAPQAAPPSKCTSSLRFLSSTVFYGETGHDRDPGHISHCRY